MIYFLLGRNYLKTYIYKLYENFLSFIGKYGVRAPPKKTIIKNEILNKNNKKSVGFKSSVKENDKNKIKFTELNTKSEIDERKIKIEKPTTFYYDTKSTYNDIIKFRESSPQKGREKNLIIEKSNKSNRSFKINKKSKGRYRNINSSDNFQGESSREKEIKLNILEEDYQKFFDEYLATSLDDMEYDDAIVYDQRAFCLYLIECLKEKQMIAYTFIASDPLKIRIIKIMLFLLNIVLYFVVIGLFFSEEYISELYDIDKENEGFFDYVPRSIDKFIYTTMVSIIIGYIVDCFFLDEKKIKGIFRREKDNLINLRQEIVGIIKEIQTRYLTFIIVIFVILLISFYYLLCFNYVYPKTQVEWVKASLTIFVIMQILSILKCFLKTCLRFLSFRCRSEKLFKISKLLD